MQFLVVMASNASKETEIWNVTLEKAYLKIFFTSNNLITELVMTANKESFSNISRR